MSTAAKFRTVLLTGPASPRDLADVFSGSTRAQAAELLGYRGTPVTGLALALLEMGLAVELVTLATEVQSAKTFRGDALRMTVVPMRATPRARIRDNFRQERKALLSAIQGSSADVVHAHWTYEFALAALASNKPTVITAHDAPLTVFRHLHDRYRFARILTAYAARLRTENLTAVSPYLASQWRRQMAYCRPISVIPNSVPQLELPKDRERPPGARVLDIADAGDHKNIPALIRACSLARHGRPELTLELIGPGLGPHDELAIRTKAAGLAAGVFFRGRVDRAEIASALSRADIFAHPSHEECCPMAVLEAMSAGLPVLAGTRAGGTPWLLGEGDAGHLVDIRSPQQIARGLDVLLENRANAQRLAENARSRASSLFAPEVVAAQYCATYDRAIAAHDGA